MTDEEARDQAREIGYEDAIPCGTWRGGTVYSLVRNEPPGTVFGLPAYGMDFGGILAPLLPEEIREWEAQTRPQKA